MTRYLAVTLAAILTAACTDTDVLTPAPPDAVGGSGGAGGSGEDGEGGDDSCQSPSACSFSGPVMWSTPIEDYWAQADASGQFSMGTLQRSIDDLMVFDDRLYFGYGDATQNVGSVIPIEVRFFSDEQSGVPSAEPVVTGEEIISLYRNFGDRLAIPGVDAADDNFVGNFLIKPSGGDFTMHRTIAAGVHVHDTASFQGAIYTCGSGAIDLDTWLLGRVHSLLWRSWDEGETWEIVSEVENDVQGDRRWIQMAAFEDELLVFGYRTNAQGSLVELIDSSWDGAALTPSDAASEHFVFGTEMLNPSAALLRAVRVVGDIRHELLLRRQGEPAQVVAAMQGHTVVDISIGADGSAVVLAADGDVYPQPDTPGIVRAFVTTDGEAFAELVAFQPPTWPVSVAFWRGHVYFGLVDGTLLRSEGIRQAD